MYALEFEADLTSEYIRIPNYDQLKNQHVRVIVLSEQPSTTSTQAKKKYDFSDLIGRLSWGGDALEEQQRLRDEWQ
jgi:hypothetical protein